MAENSEQVNLAIGDFDEDEAAEHAVADLIGFRTNPHRGGYLAVSMVRSAYKSEALALATEAAAEKTRSQLDALSIFDPRHAAEFFAFCVGYLGARMFQKSLGEGPVLSRLLMPEEEPIDDSARKESITRAAHYIPALSEIHDTRGGPRDSRLIYKMFSHYLTLLVADPRQATLDNLLGAGDETALRAAAVFSARQIAETLDRVRLWTTLGYRRGQAERRFRTGPRAAYLENLAGDVRIIFEPGQQYAVFADIRRLRHVDLATVRARPHPCDDAEIAAWIAENCALAGQFWSKPD